MAKHDALADQRMQDYVDGRLSEQERAEFAAYLLTHPEIAAEVNLLRRQNEALKGIGHEVLDEPVPDRLRDVLYRPKVISLESRRMRPSGFLEAAAAILLFCVGGALGWFANGTLNPSVSKDDLTLSDAVSAYAFYGGHQGFPIEFPPDRSDELATWISRSFSTEFAPPDLEALGYRYLGGRLLPGATSKIGAFMFQNADDEQVVVFFWPTEAPPQDVIKVSHQRDLETRFWFGEGFGFAVIGGGSTSDIQEVAEAVFSFYEGELDPE
jgi:anti-sigma factor RsiW